MGDREPATFLEHAAAFYDESPMSGDYDAVAAAAIRLAQAIRNADRLMPTRFRNDVCEAMDKFDMEIAE